MKSPCYLVTLSLESSDFQTFLKQYVILVPLALCLFHRMNNKSSIFTSGEATSENTAFCVHEFSTNLALAISARCV